MKQLPKGMAESFGKLLLTAAFLQDSYLQLSFYNTIDGMARGLLKMTEKYTDATEKDLDKIREEIIKNAAHITNRASINKHLALVPLLRGINYITYLSITQEIAIIRPEFFQVPSLTDETMDRGAEDMQRLD